MSVESKKQEWPDRVLKGLQQAVADMISEPDLQAVLDKAVVRTAELVDADIATIHILDRLTGRVRTAAGYGVSDWDTFRQHEPGRGKVGLLVAQKAEPVIAEKVSDSELAGPFATREGVQSAAGFPLQVAEEVAGWLFVSYRKPHKFEPEEIESLVSFANLAVITIEKVRLLDDAQRRIRDLEIINRVAEIMGNKLETGDLLQALVDQIAKELHCTHCAFFMPDVPTDQNKEVLLEPKVFCDTREGRTLDRTFRPGEGLAGWVFKNGQSVRLAHARQDERFAPAKEPTEKPLSMLVVPVKAGDRVIGVISADQNARDWFSRSDQRLVEALARHAGIAIERATGLQLLQDIGKLIVGRHDVRDILQRIVCGALQIVGATSGVIYLLSEDGLSIIQSFEHPPGFDHPVPRMAGKGGITRRILKTRQMMIFPDIRKSRLVNPLMRDRVRSMSGIPLKLEQEVIGVLYLNHAEQHSYTETEVSLLLMLSDQAAIAIHEARLLNNLERQVRGHRTLNEVGAELAGMLDEKEILEHVARSAANTLDCTHCSVFCVETDKLVIGAAEGNRKQSLQPGRTFDLGQGVAGWVAQEGKPALVPNTHQDDRFDPGWSKGQADPQSLVVVPMLIGGDVYGVISAEEDRTAAFDEYDQRLLETLALQASQAVRNARLHADRKRQIERLQALNQVGQELSTELEEDLIFNAVTEAVVRTLDCTHCTMFVLEGDHLVPRASHGKDQHIKITRCFPLGEGVAGWVAKEGKAVLAPNAKKDPRFVEGETRPDVDRSMIGVPVKVDSQFVGVISADQDRANAFDDRDLQIVETIALQAAISIQNTRLLERERQRAEAMDALQQIFAEISATLDLDETLKLIIEGAMQLTKTESGVIHLVDASRSSVIRSYEVPTDFGHFSSRFSEKKGLTWTIVDTGQMVVVPDILEDSRVNPDMIEKGVRANIGVPLIVEGEIIGALFLNDSKPRQFTEYEKGPLSALASRAAIAINNARLFEDHRERIKDLSALNRISQGLSSEDPLTVHDMSGLLYQVARELMDMRNFYVASYNSEKNLVTFEFAVENGAEVETGEGEWVPRIKGNGLTEAVIQKGDVLYIPSNVGEWRDEHGAYDGLRYGAPWTEWKESGEPSLTGESWLGLPIKIGQEILGVIGVQNYESSDAYDEYDREVLSTVAAQLGIALVRQHLSHRNEELKRKTRELEVLTEIGRTVSNLGIDQILDLVYENMEKIIDLRDAQVQFAFYDETEDEVSFPLAVEQDKEREGVIDRVRWGLREAQYRRPDEDESVEQFRPRARREPPGLNEYVIRNKEPLLIVEDFEQEAKAKGIRIWPTFGRLNRPTESWLGVPMMVGGRVTGVISIQSLEQEYAFDQGHVQVLSAVANQAAVAIENACLYQQSNEQITELRNAQTRIAETEAALVRASVAADFVHRINNLAGTIPIWVDMIRQEISQQETEMSEVIEYLDEIQRDTNGLLRAAEQLRYPPSRQNIDVAFLLESILRQVRVQYHDRIRLRSDIQPNLYKVSAVPFSLAGALWNIISNGIEAMPGEPGDQEVGVLTVSASNYQDSSGSGCVRIEIRDSGKGIPEEDQDKIFVPFFTTKGPGRGYGLWRAETIIKEIGGKIDVESQAGIGTTFAILIPGIAGEE